MKETLKTKGEFKAARRGRYINTDMFTVVLSKPLEEPKVAYVTSAKVGNAVQRNYLRRVARVVFNAANDKGKTMVVIFKPGSGAYYTKGEGNLAQDLAAALK